MICTWVHVLRRFCVGHQLDGVCPNCGGNFAARPIRTGSHAL